MNFIFDNIGASIVGATVFLILLSLQIRINNLNIEETSTYMVKNQASNLATWLEEDLLKMGTNIDNTKEVPFANPVDSAEVTTQFIFYRDTLNTAVVPADTVRIGTRYQLKMTETRMLEGAPINVYRIDRSLQYNGGAWISSGQSASMVGSLKIDMLDRDAQPVVDPVAAMTADPEAIKNTRVRFSMVTPFETDQISIRQVYYGSTLLLPN